MSDTALRNILEAYAKLSDAEASGKSASNGTKAATQEFYEIAIEHADRSTSTVSGILEEIADDLGLKVRVEICTTEGQRILKNGKPMTTTVGSVDAPSKFKQIRAAVRRLEKSAPEMITPNWTETHKAYRELLDSEQTDSDKIHKLVKSLIKKFPSIAMLRLAAELITAHCDKSELHDDAEKAAAA